MMSRRGCLVSIVAVLCLVVTNTGTVSARERCLKDEDLGTAYEANIYYCEDSDKPVCCQRDDEHTCCEDESKKTWREQLQLWGALAVVVIIIAVVIICWKKDTYLCEGKTLAQRCSACCCKRCRKKNEKDEDIMRIRISRKYQKHESRGGSANSSGTGRSHGADVTASVAHMKLNNNADDVDSGRGSVTSSRTGHHPLDTDVFVVTKDKAAILPSYHDVIGSRNDRAGRREQTAPEVEHSTPPEVLKQQSDMLRMHQETAAAVVMSSATGHAHDQQQQPAVRLRSPPPPDAKRSRQQLSPLSSRHDVSARPMPDHDNDGIAMQQFSINDAAANDDTTAAGDAEYDIIDYGKKKTTDVDVDYDVVDEREMTAAGVDANDDVVDEGKKSKKRKKKKKKRKSKHSQETEEML